LSQAAQQIPAVCKIESLKVSAMTIPDLPPMVHTLFEAISYFVGVRLYLWQSARRPARSRLLRVDALWVAAGAVAGAALGSKVVYWMQYPSLLEAHWREPAVLFGGKTIVGGLLGGLAGVELTKAWRAIRQSTGDDFVVPLIVGMSIGRIGCFLAGIPDNTYGIESSLPWAVTYSDGIARHPAPLYEILFLLLFWPWVAKLRRSMPCAGDTFKVFFASYLAFRFAAEFIKPPFGTLQSPLEHNVTRIDLYGSTVTGIQIACLLGLTYYLLIAARRARNPSWQK
jgi:phosphatidylglycerol:prolipoprotein diacylglycerol transferase